MPEKTNINTDTDSYFVKLKNRGFVYIEGEDRVAFLQNLVTNDLELLDKQPALYSCLLTPQGKFLHDFFIVKGEGFFILDCEGGARADDLYKTLNRYRLRSKVTLSVEEQSSVYAVFGTEAKDGYADPRHNAMGYRTFNKPGDLEERVFDVWDQHRITLCIPDGSRDMVPESSTLLEFRIDGLNGVSFTKGCYVGQEVTARMKHRGLLKKQSHVITGDALPACGEDILLDGKIAGEMRSSCGDTGIALIKNDMTGMFGDSPYKLLS